MHWFKKFFSRRQIYRDLSEEIQQHLEEKIEELVASGMGRDEATQRAKHEFGNAVLFEERSREVWRGPVLESFWLDLKYGIRQLRKSPGLTLTAVLTLALGMGVNTSIFTVFHQVLLRTMPVRKPADLVLLQEQSRFETGTLNMWGGDPGMYFSYPAYQALRDGNGVLEGLAVSTVAPATIVSVKDADKVKMQLVSGNYFTLLGVQPALGRLITPSDDTYHEGRAVAVLSDSYWHGHFGSDPSILNQEIQINGSAFTVVGVVRHEGLMDAAPSAVFLPISMQRAVVPGNADLLIGPLNRWLNLMGRLSPGVTRMQAEAQLNTLWWNWRRDVLKAKESNITDQKDWLETHLSVADGARGIPLLEGTLGRPIRILETMAFVVLLIACGNVTNLLLAKAVRKHFRACRTRRSRGQPPPHLSASDLGRSAPRLNGRRFGSASRLAKPETPVKNGAVNEHSAAGSGGAYRLAGDCILRCRGCTDQRDLQHRSRDSEYSRRSPRCSTPPKRCCNWGRWEAP